MKLCSDAAIRPQHHRTRALAANLPGHLTRMSRTSGRGATVRLWHGATDRPIVASAGEFEYLRIPENRWSRHAEARDSDSQTSTGQGDQRGTYYSHGGGPPIIKYAEKAAPAARTNRFRSRLQGGGTRHRPRRKKRISTPGFVQSNPTCPTRRERSAAQKAGWHRSMPPWAPCRAGSPASGDAGTRP